MEASEFYKQSKRSHNFVETFLHDLYSDQSATADCTEAELKKLSYSLTYGFIYYESMQKIIRYLELSTEDYLIELGSGIGRSCLHIALATPVAVVHGIEYVVARHTLAKQIQNQTEKQLKLQQIFFSQGNFLEQDLAAATVIFMDATSFSHQQMLAIRDKLLKLENLRTVVSLKRIICFSEFNCSTAFSVECSWGTGKCYVYIKG